MHTIPGVGDTRLKARPTTYAGVKMRSRLEADYARHLDATGIQWVYESRCFAGPPGQYLPDFELAGAGAFVEVKPADLYLTDEESGEENIHEALRKMEIIWLTEPNAWLFLVMWRYQAAVPVLTYEADGLGCENWRVIIPGISMTITSLPTGFVALWAGRTSMTASTPTRKS